MRDIGDIWKELREHPDFIECVIWTREDVETHIQELEETGYKVNASVDDIISLMDMSGWESYAIECGWEAIYDDVQTYGNVTEETINA